MKRNRNQRSSLLWQNTNCTDFIKELYVEHASTLHRMELCFAFITEFEVRSTCHIAMKLISGRPFYHSKKQIVTTDNYTLVHRFVKTMFGLLPQPLDSESPTG